MSDVASHLGFPLAEYDARIRTFLPCYEEMLEEVGRVVSAVATDTPSILELGIGTAALAARCLEARPRARLIGIDADADILALAQSRLAGRDVELHAANYLNIELPSADLIVSSLSLHHVGDVDAKCDLYVRCRRSLRDGGSMVLADCYQPSDPRQAASAMTAWLRFLERSYTPSEAQAHLDAWSREDTYFPLEDELEWLRLAGFRPDVIWRRDMFAVLLCR